ncbi:hypothetical protein [Oceanicola sp. S124]|uniref:hypothetical protein n=1 Tax=Oceanicola sp. S124 TaxID=1042378 RepID=UPI000255A959|nr:hypothetical protein [Oceanicola sp. S124]
MSNLKTIATERDQCAEAVIARLEEALEHARENPQAAVSIFTMGRDGVLSHGHTCDSTVHLVGMIEMQKAEIMTSWGDD